MKKKMTFGRLLLLVILIVYTVFLFFPIATILLTSFVPSSELATSTEFIWWPEQFTLDAYKTIFVYDTYIDTVGLPGLLLGFINTMWLTLIPLLVGLLMAGFSAYAFSKMNFPFKEKLFKFSVIIRSVPLGAFGVISYVFYSAIGWTGELGFLPLLIPGMFGGIGTMWLAVGGGLYTFGTVFYLWRGLPYHHPVWHVFVLAGSICHFFCILWYVM